MESQIEIVMRLWSSSERMEGHSTFCWCVLIAYRRRLRVMTDGASGRLYVRAPSFWRVVPPDCELCALGEVRGVYCWG